MPEQAIAGGQLNGVGDTISLGVIGYAGGGIQLSGTWVGTVQFEATIDGGNWVAVNAVPANGSSAVTSATGNGAWQLAVAGLRNIRVRLSAWTSGVIVVAMRADYAGPSGGGAGGGGGAVTIADGADVAEGSTADAAWSGSGAGTVVSILKKLAGGGISVVTGNAPTFATVGVTSAQAVAANSSRKGLLLTNTSGNFISLGFDGHAAVLYSGLTLTPYGVLELTPAMISQGAITAIASGASSNLGIQELQ